jgi:hypothetical protein
MVNQISNIDHWIYSSKFIHFYGEIGEVEDAKPNLLFSYFYIRFNSASNGFEEVVLYAFLSGLNGIIYNFIFFAYS